MQAIAATNTPGLKNFRPAILGLFFILATGCGAGQYRYAASAYLSPSEQRSFLYGISRYLAPLPENANHDNKFDPVYDAYYLRAADRHRLWYYYRGADDMAYFMVTRVAPSIREKYIATGGKLKRSSNGAIHWYEELFRTWKMPIEELLATTEPVFRDMVAGRDLSPYYPENSGDRYIIEFPNRDVYYDPASRRWISKREAELKPTP
jgi:hypothetical protein